MSRVFIHVQHLLGTGHLRRAAALARAFVTRGHDVLVATGGMAVEGVDCGGADLVQLPPVRALDDTFSALVDPDGRPIDDEWRHARADKLMCAATAFEPDVIVTEHFPFGRRAFRFELVPLLEKFHREALIVGSVRDVLVQKPNGMEKSRWSVDLVRSCYDAVLVHGDATLTPFSATFPRAAEIADKLHYTGYIVGGLPFVADDEATGDGHDEIIVSVGGGAVGEQLLQAAIAAAGDGELVGKTWRLLVGRNMAPSALEELRRKAGGNVIVEWARPDFRQLLYRAALSVSQAGYNTLMDLLVTKCPAVVVPFETGSENEQRFRADLFAQAGLLSVLPESGLSGESLGGAVRTALRRGKPASKVTPQLAGDLRSAEIVENLLEERAAKKVRV